MEDVSLCRPTDEIQPPLAGLSPTATDRAPRAARPSGRDRATMAIGAERAGGRVG